MRRIIGTIGATLAFVVALAATPATAQDDRSLSPGAPRVLGPADGMQDTDGLGLGVDWEDDWFEDYEEGDWFEDREEASTALMLVNLQFIPWAQSHDKFVALRSHVLTANAIPLVS